MDYSYEVVAFYTTTLQFLGLEGKKLSGLDHKALPGDIYFKLKTNQRSKENPYGLLITDFTFVDPKKKDAYQEVIMPNRDYMANIKENMILLRATKPNTTATCIVITFKKGTRVFNGLLRGRP